MKKQSPIVRFAVVCDGMFSVLRCLPKRQQILSKSSPVRLVFSETEDPEIGQDFARANKARYLVRVALKEPRADGHAFDCSRTPDESPTDRCTCGLYQVAKMEKKRETADRHAKWKQAERDRQNRRRQERRVAAREMAF